MVIKATRAAEAPPATAAAAVGYVAYAHFMKRRKVCVYLRIAGSVTLVPLSLFLAFSYLLASLFITLLSRILSLFPPSLSISPFPLLTRFPRLSPT